MPKEKKTNSKKEHKEKNLYSNGKLYLSKDLKKTLKVDAGDTVGIYKKEKKIVVEKFEGVCLHCHSEKVTKNDKGAVCFKCSLKANERLDIAEAEYTLSVIPGINIINIPETIRESIGFIVQRNKDNEYVSDKFPVSIKKMPNKKRLIITKSKTTV